MGDLLILVLCHLLLLLQFAFLFIFPLWSLKLGLPKLCWVTVTRVDRFSCFWPYRKCFIFSPLRLMLALGFSYMTLLRWGRFHLCCFWRGFFCFVFSNKCWCCSVIISCPTLQSHHLQNFRLNYPSIFPGICSNSLPQIIKIEFCQDFFLHVVKSLYRFYFSVH